jgi:hypothetical protein
MAKKTTKKATKKKASKKKPASPDANQRAKGLIEMITSRTERASN